MIIVEVKTSAGKVIEREEFSIYDLAVKWYERALELYGKGVSITFGDSSAVLR